MSRPKGPRTAPQPPAMTLDEANEREMGNFTFLMQQRIMSLMEQKITSQQIRNIVKIINLTDPMPVNPHAGFRLDLKTLSRRTLLLIYEYLAFGSYPDIQQVSQEVHLPPYRAMPSASMTGEIKAMPVAQQMQKTVSNTSSVASTSKLPMVALPAKSVSKQETAKVEHRETPVVSQSQNYCDICKKKFSTKEGFRDHLYNVSKPNHSYKAKTHPRCELCAVNFPSALAFDEHNEQKHPPEPLFDASEDEIKVQLPLATAQTPALTSTSDSPQSNSGLSTSPLDPFHAFVELTKSHSKRSSTPTDFAASPHIPWSPSTPQATAPDTMTSLEDPISRPLLGVSILVSKAVLLTLTRPRLQALTDKVGATLIDFDQPDRFRDATHFLHNTAIGDFLEFRMAVNRDLWIVHSDWLLECAHQQSYLDETVYLLREKLDPRRPSVPLFTPLQTFSTPQIDSPPTPAVALPKLQEAAQISPELQRSAPEAYKSLYCTMCNQTFFQMDHYVDHLVMEGCLTQRREMIRQGQNRSIRLDPQLGIERNYISDALDIVGQVDRQIALLRPLLLNLRYLPLDTSIEEVLYLYQKDAINLDSTKTGASSNPRERIKTKHVMCSICLSPAKQVRVTSCGHVGCNLCMTSCIQQLARCPVCRTELALENLGPLYLNAE